MGNYFDGKYFTVPTDGLYSFHIASRHKSGRYGQINLRVNDCVQSYCYVEESSTDIGFVNIQTTLKLNKNDKVHARFSNELYNTTDGLATYFEGRLIARIDE